MVKQIHFMCVRIVWPDVSKNLTLFNTFGVLRMKGDLYCRISAVSDQNDGGCIGPIFKDSNHKNPTRRLFNL